jgi:hypothetical protein
MTVKTDRPTYAVEAIPSDIKNSVFLGNPMLDNVVSSLIAMGTEMWATKRRLKVVEAVMAQKGITNEMIEQYTPSDAETAAWEADRDRFIDLAFGPLANQNTTGIAADFPKRPGS